MWLLDGRADSNLNDTSEWSVPIPLEEWLKLDDPLDSAAKREASPRTPLTPDRNRPGNATHSGLDGQYLS